MSGFHCESKFFWALLPMLEDYKTILCVINFNCVLVAHLSKPRFTRL